MGAQGQRGTTLRERTIMRLVAVNGGEIGGLEAVQAQMRRKLDPLATGGWREGRARLSSLSSSCTTKERRAMG